MPKIMTFKEAYTEASQTFEKDIRGIKLNNQFLAAFITEMDQIISEVVTERFSSTHHPEKAREYAITLRNNHHKLITDSSKGLLSLQAKMSEAIELGSRINSYIKGTSYDDTFRIMKYIDPDLEKQLKATCEETSSYETDLSHLHRALRGVVCQRESLIRTINGRVRTWNNLFSDRGFCFLFCTNLYSYLKGERPDINIPFSAPSANPPAAPAAEAIVAAAASSDTIPQTTRSASPPPSPAAAPPPLAPKPLSSDDRASEEWVRFVPDQAAEAPA